MGGPIACLMTCTFHPGTICGSVSSSQAIVLYDDTERSSKSLKTRSIYALLLSAWLLDIRDDFPEPTIVLTVLTEATFFGMDMAMRSGTEMAASVMSMSCDSGPSTCTEATSGSMTGKNTTPGPNFPYIKMPEITNARQKRARSTGWLSERCRSFR